MKKYLVKIKSYYFNNRKRIDIDTIEKGKIVKLDEFHEVNASKLINGIFTDCIEKGERVTFGFYNWVLDKTTEILNNLTYFSYEEIKQNE